MWTKDEVIGRGASGTTWRGEYEGRTVAIKEIPLEDLDAKRRELASREAEVLRQLSHPAIPAYFAHSVEECVTLVMEFVEGQSLGDEAAERRYTPVEVVAVMQELADVLEYLHGLSPPVVHRDLKPSNVIRRPDGSLVLIDFGAVRDHLTVLGGSTVAGTFGYMAPEQFAGDAVPASDLYALGALAIRLLTRRDPRTLLDHANRMNWREHAQVPAALAAVLEDLVEPDVEKRIASVEELRRRLADPLPPRPEPRASSLSEDSVDLLGESLDEESLDERSLDYARVGDDDRAVDELFEPDTDPGQLERRRPEPATVARRRMVIVVAVLLALMAGIAGGFLSVRTAQVPVAPTPIEAPVPPTAPADVQSQLESAADSCRGAWWENNPAPAEFIAAWPPGGGTPIITATPKDAAAVGCVTHAAASVDGLAEAGGTLHWTK